MNNKAHQLLLQLSKIYRVNITYKINILKTNYLNLNLCYHIVNYY